MTTHEVHAVRHVSGSTRGITLSGLSAAYLGVAVKNRDKCP